MVDFKEGTPIEMKYGGKAIVQRKLGSGGQGTVYEVLYNGKRCALKWYHSNAFKENAEAFYKNLENIIKAGAPTKSFLWPQAITQYNNGCNSFGYVMDVRPEGYHELTEFFIGSPQKKQVRFRSFDAVCNAAINIISGFRELHNAGYSYQDINNGNFFIKPETGEVLICDNDNVSANKESLGILGKQRYMAPEVVTGKSNPDKKTDIFSLSVILFRLLFINHPLEGIRSTPPCMTKEFERKYYGEEPVFVYDPVNQTNTPVPGTDANLKKLWKVYPDFIQNIFIRAFSQTALFDRDKRVTEKDWLDTFFRLKANIVPCPHCSDGAKEGTFVIKPGSNHCIHCQKSIVINNTLKCQSFELPLYPGVRVLHYHLDTYTQDMFTQFGMVIRNPKNPNLIGIKNTSPSTWIVTLPDSTQKEVAPSAVVPIKAGFTIDFTGNKSESAQII